MQMETIKHELLKIDGKITGVVISKKEFNRIIKFINITNQKSKGTELDDSIPELERIRSERKGKRIPVDKFFKKYL
jgi:hypothetical protein